MRWAILATLAVLGLGCRGRAKGPVVPAAPPVAAAAEPVSVPQTAVRLPPEQPVPPEAVPPESKPQAPPPEATPAVPAPEPKPAVRTRPPAVVARPAPAPEPAPASPTTPEPLLRPVLTREQEQDLSTRIERSLAAAHQSLVRAGNADRQAAARVKAFIDQAVQARRQGDLIRARSLAERAEWLAADLIQAVK